MGITPEVHAGHDPRSPHGACLPAALFSGTTQPLNASARVPAMPTHREPRPRDTIGTPILVSLDTSNGYVEPPSPTRGEGRAHQLPPTVRPRRPRTRPKTVGGNVGSGLPLPRLRFCTPNYDFVR